MAAKMSQNQPPLSQELDARFSVFLNPIRDLTKNWEVDIAKYLEEYLEELAGVTLSLDGGVTSMNFAEAAMLIQGSVTVYSKKVDFLWQMVLKTLDLLSSRRALEDSGMEVAAGAGGGGRKNRMEIVHSFSCIDSIMESHNIELREDDDDDNDSRRKSIKFLPSTPLNLVEKEVEKSQNRISLRMKSNELLGAKDDFRITRSYLTAQGVLHLEVPSEILEGRANATATTSTCSMLAGHRQTEAAGVPTDIPELEIRADSEQDYHSPMEDDCHPPDDDPPPPEEDPPPPGEDPPPPEEDPPPPGEAIPPPGEDPPPPEVPTEDPDQNYQNNNNEMAIEFPKQRYGLRKRKEEAEVVATLKMTDKLKPFDPNADCPPKRPPRAGRLRVPTPCPCHRRSETKRQKNKKNNNLASKSYLPLEEYITSELKDIISKKTKKERSKKIPPEILEKAAEEEANRINVAKEKVVERLGEEGVSREEALQAAEEATQEDRVSPNIEDEDDDPLMNDAPVDLDLDSTGFVLPEVHPDREFPEGGTVAAAARLNDSLASEEPASEYEALVLKWVADFVNNAQESIKCTELERIVNQWRKTVTPRLQAEAKRTEFDIHRYGSQILSLFPSDGRKQTISFKQSMKGQDNPREVCRFFLSCLMLANSHNIELSTSDPGDLAMDCLELTLKSRVRHHEELEEYMAPLQACRSSETEMECLSNRGPPGVCADITQTTNLQNEANIVTKKGCGKKRALPR